MTKQTAASGISALRLRQLQELLALGLSDRFYDWPEWAAARDDVLRMDLGECQLCKARGRYRKAALVHHVQHLKDRPDLALSVFDPDTGRRQLVSLCRGCHEEQHPERMRRTAPKPEPLTEERWD